MLQDLFILSMFQDLLILSMLQDLSILSMLHDLFILELLRRNETDCADQNCEDNVFKFLKRNFEYNYNSNRAPFGVFTHHSWFLLDEINESTAHTNGYLRFVRCTEIIS